MKRNKEKLRMEQTEAKTESTTGIEFTTQDVTTVAERVGRELARALATKVQEEPMVHNDPYHQFLMTAHAMGEFVGVMTKSLDGYCQTYHADDAREVLDKWLQDLFQFYRG